MVGILSQYVRSSIFVCSVVFIMRNKLLAFFVLGSRSSSAFISLSRSRRFYTSSLAMSKKVLVPIAEGYDEKNKIEDSNHIDKCH